MNGAQPKDCPRQQMHHHLGHSQRQIIRKETYSGGVDCVIDASAFFDGKVNHLVETVQVGDVDVTGQPAILWMSCILLADTSGCLGSLVVEVSEDD